MRTEQQIRSNALDILTYIANCESGNAAAVDAFLSTVNTADDLWDMVTALSGYCVGMLRVSSQLTGRDPGALLGALRQDLQDNR